MPLPDGTVNVGFISSMGSTFNMPEETIMRICEILKEEQQGDL